ncbi:MocR-like pyridoxine biosynthesis transcription factor PdxR [Petrocella sp. FN5]|uniref:MocR-like pyridoxine biosynthesis transcription factor PdxR n=1 Tax=Petrocella sp. FN5 TaxID=3032002 RepID=UPI0023DAA2C2|nr:PLP-dependent aminotransferase family protein [Petrocella sp. FN5]MDF1617553.1 PLP-dependent aminotransferase family protein [Petrocella sp. FN5]
MLLTPEINYELKKPIYMQIHDYLVKEMVEGRLIRNDKLPSVRVFSDHLGISRNSVENAFNQLLAEGYILSVPRKGYYVAEIEDIKGKKMQSIEEVSQDTKQQYVYDFKSEYVAKDSFDYKLWKKHLNYVMNYDVDVLYEHGDPRGERVLRAAIAKHFYRTRGVVARTDSIVIGGGITPLLTILGKLFDNLELDDIGMEDPGFNKAKHVFDYSHLKTIPIEVNEKGIDISLLYQEGVRLCYVSPSHQFPTGTIMPVDNRLKLLNWAEKVDGYIIEDDYNAELRFEGQPIPAMQSLDEGDRVIYLGSFSTVLAPGIRISFMVLPRVLNQYYTKNIEYFSQTASKLEQLALSKLIESGDFDRHVRKIRNYYAKKQGNVLKYIKVHLPKNVIPKHGKAGLQIMLRLPDGWDESDVVLACEREGIGISGLGVYRSIKKKPSKPYLILGYRGIDERRMEDGIKELGKVLMMYKETYDEKSLIGKRFLI